MKPWGMHVLLFLYYLIRPWAHRLLQGRDGLLLGFCGVRNTIRGAFLSLPPQEGTGCNLFLEEKPRKEKDKALASDGIAVHLWKDGGKCTSERESMDGMTKVGSGGLQTWSGGNDGCHWQHISQFCLSCLWVTNKLEKQLRQGSPHAELCVSCPCETAEHSSIGMSSGST